MDVTYKEQPPITPIDYNERGLFDYRRFMAHEISPRFEFGFGLSYAAFEYSMFEIQEFPKPPMHELVPKKDQEASVGEALHQTVYEISCEVTNISAIDGTEVRLLVCSLEMSSDSSIVQIAQLYVQFPQESWLVLRGFEHLFLRPNESRRVTFPLSTYALSKWYAQQRRWIRPNGRFSVAIGRSCKNIELTGHL